MSVKIYVDAIAPSKQEALNALTRNGIKYTYESGGSFLGTFIVGDSDKERAKKIISESCGGCSDTEYPGPNPYMEDNWS